MTTTKTCIHCGKKKTTDDFYTHPVTRDNLAVWCISCCRARIKEYALAHPEYVAAALEKIKARNDASHQHATANRKRWEKEEDDFIREFWATENVDDISKALNRTFYAVKSRANVLGIRHLKKHPSEQ